MPICKKCSKKWTWKQTIKTLFRFKCPHCRKRQYESASSRKRTGMICLIPLIALPITTLLKLPWWMVGVFMLPIIVVIWIIYPFIIEISDEEEPLW
jgi:CXXC-20-CXXC protein